MRDVYIREIWNVYDGILGRGGGSKSAKQGGMPSRLSRDPEPASCEITPRSGGRLPESVVRVSRDWCTMSRRAPVTKYVGERNVTSGETSVPSSSWRRRGVARGKRRSALTGGEGRATQRGAAWYKGNLPSAMLALAPRRSKTYHNLITNYRDVGAPSTGMIVTPVFRVGRLAIGYFT